MRRSYEAMVRGLVCVAALASGFCAASCGKESLAEQMAGTYATDPVQAELEDHEREFISDSFHGRFDAVDKAEAEETGDVWARLRLKPDGRFEYEGPSADGGEPDCRLAGRWTARPGTLELTVERATGPGADELSKTLVCAASPRSVDLPFLKTPGGASPLRLERR
jgi:hypothetical protein